MSGISIIVPVGPEQHHRRYLDECLDSISRQTHLPNEVLLVDDMAGMPAGLDHSNGYPTRTWRAPWRLGVAAAFNCGVALAEQELVLMVGADDWLEPDCVRCCLETFSRNKEELLAYYFLTVQYRAEDSLSVPADLDDGIQTVPCNAAMVSKSLWEHTGGFPPEVGSGAPDAALISIMLHHNGSAGKLFPIFEGTPLYNVRVHDMQDTAFRRPWQGVILDTRGLLTENWKQPEWGRYR